MDNKEMNEKILNKKFKKAVFSGYDMTDVDSFYDSIIEYLKNNNKMVELYKADANKFKEQVKALQSTNAALLKDKAKLIKEIQELKSEGYGKPWLKGYNQSKK